MRVHGLEAPINKETSLSIVHFSSPFPAGMCAPKIYDRRRARTSAKGGPVKDKQGLNR